MFAIAFRLFLCGLALMGGGQVSAQPSKSIDEAAVEICAVSKSDTSPAEISSIRERLGDNFSGGAPICLVYIRAWKSGYDTAYAEEKRAEYNRTCSYILDKAKAGDSSAMQSYITRNSLSAIEAANLAQHCNIFKEGYTAGLLEARRIMRQ